MENTEHKFKGKKLYRSQNDKVLAGVCGGLGEFFDVDSVLIRLFWLLVVIFTGIFPGVIIYIFAIFLVPMSPNKTAPAE